MHLFQIASTRRIYTQYLANTKQCILIGYNFNVPYGEPLVLDSMLPWTLVFNTVEGGSLYVASYSPHPNRVN